MSFKKQQKNTHQRQNDSQELDSSHKFKESSTTDSYNRSSSDLNLQNHEELIKKLKERMTPEQIEFFRKRGLVFYNIFFTSIFYFLINIFKL